MPRCLKAALGAALAPTAASDAAPDSEPRTLPSFSAEWKEERSIAPVNSPEDVVNEGSPRRTTLVELLNVCDLSVRLRRMLQETSLGATTVSDFENRRTEIEEWMMTQRNCGRRSVAELRGVIPLLTSHSGANDETAGMPEHCTVAVGSSAGLPDNYLRMGESTIGDLLMLETLSARLAQMLNQTKLGAIPLRTYMEGRHDIEAWMRKQPNCGRHTVRELRAALAKRDLQLSADIFLDDSTPHHSGIMVKGSAPSQDDHAPPVGGCIRDLVEWHLANLPARTADVLRQRFGLDCRPRTLEEIGKILSRTRERIRQIEAKGIKRIRAICRRHPMDDQLDDARFGIVDTLFGDALHVTDSHFECFVKAMDGHVLLALEFAGVAPKEWLAKVAIKIGRGWLRPGVDASAVSTIAADLGEAYSKRPFPRAAEEIVGTRTRRLALAASELLLGWHLEGSYFFERKPRTRLLRTASLHAVLSRLSVPTEISELLVEYRAAVSADQCSDRDLVIVMEVASHLFIETSEGCWAAIGCFGDPIPGLAEPSSLQSEQEIARELDDTTIAFALERELQQTGPRRVGQLINRAIDIIPNGRSTNSVGPTLLLHPSRFVRVLPGIYALPEQVPDERRLAQSADLGYLLNYQQARLFALARWAGEPWGSYPLWTVTAEMRLCRWARANKQDELLRSLLAIASIEQWPTDDVDQLMWLDLMKRQARFELEFAPRRAKILIPLDRVLAAGLHLRSARSLGWMTANRVLGHGPDASAAAALLSGMVRSGMAASPTDCGSWQRPHLAGAALEEWIARLASELHDTGELAWSGVAGSELSKAFERQEASQIKEAPDLDEELDEFELMMAEHRRSVQSRRQEACLEMALE